MSLYFALLGAFKRLLYIVTWKVISQVGWLKVHLLLEKHNECSISPIYSCLVCRMLLTFRIHWFPALVALKVYFCCSVLLCMVYHSRVRLCVIAYYGHVGRRKWLCGRGYHEISGIGLYVTETDRYISKGMQKPRRYAKFYCSCWLWK